MIMHHYDEKWIESFNNGTSSKILQGNDNDSVFIFIHGFGTTSFDLFPLAKSFNIKGYACEMILLKGHSGDVDELSALSYGDWLSQIRSSYEYHKSKGKKVYIVGFSLGALLAIDFASMYDIDGIVAIGAFLRPSFKLRAGFKLMIKLFPKTRFVKRWLNTSNKKTRNELSYYSHLPAEKMIMINEEASRIFARIESLSCPILFFHSINDKVANYMAVLEFIKHKTEHGRLITLRYLNHFIQFDSPSYIIRDLALMYFGINTKNNGIFPQEVNLKESISHFYEEQKHWADTIFKLIVGFFTIFGALLYYTLDKIIKKTDESPYYLISYSLIINIYILLFSLYYFYMTRTIQYIKNHIEPLLRSIPHFILRQNIFASGKASGKMTQRATILVIFAPLMLSLTIIIYTISVYSDKILNLSSGYIFIKSAIVFTIVLFLFLLKSIFSTIKYAEIESKYTLPPEQTTPEFESLLCKYYQSIKPGCVCQSFDRSVLLDEEILD
jgi:esterase/lipase